MIQKLSVAFIWHMHQPTYKDMETKEYLMPWVRLHAIKDYLDMVLILEDFPKIKQTFNLVPSLIDQLNDYGHNGAHDIHSRLTETDINDLSNDDRTFILEHFFDANYANMVFPHEPYRKLHEKRHQLENITVESFSDQEYSDILVWFNLAWLDPYWIENNPDLNRLYNKGSDYTLDDRKLLISIQREIIRNIIPKYRQMLEKGQIEISTSPYYHPIIPILIDSQSASRAISDIQLPESNFKLIQDGREQIIRGINKFTEIFGKPPSGIWPSEQCISPEALELMSDLGIKWTITDEGNLAKTIEKEFIRDFRGDLEDPYDLCKAYQADINGKNIFLVFRNSVISDLIGFEYGNHDPVMAANDLYERIKNIQSKLQITPEKNHLVTIALDGENCWESYKGDGRAFLYSLYDLLSEDNSLDVTTVSEFISKIENPSILKNIHSGSWINRNFQLWIGDPTKNLAWDYLINTRNDLENFINNENYSEETIKKAWEEIYIAEGSDWFWWYGEPNDSGQDDLFDKLFRNHLISVYNLLDKPVPEYLRIPIEMFVGKPARNPRGLLRPNINGEVNSEEEWSNAGCIEIPQGPMYQSDKLVKRIFFGNDTDNLYFRFDVNQIIDSMVSSNEIYIYFFIPEQVRALSPIRLRNKGTTVFPTQRYAYAYELEIPVSQHNILPATLSESIEGLLWKVKRRHNIIHKHKSVLEIAVPFSDIDIEESQEIHFSIAISKSHILQDIIPQNRTLNLKRPETQLIIN